MSEVAAEVRDVLRDELLILAESDDGQSVPWAVRPLTDQERRSGVRFGDIHQIQETLLEALEPVLVGLMGATAAECVGLAGKPAREVLDAVAEWRTTLPPALADEVGGALPKVEEALVESYRASSRLVVQEAARQGVRLSPVTDAPAWTRPVAETVTRTPVERVLDATRNLHQSPRAQVDPPDKATVQAELDDLSVKGPVDQARQANHAAVNAARTDTVEANPRKPSWLYSSEVMDGRTCPRCSTIDGTEWGTLEEARVAYPPGAGYRDCEGGPRCRGTLVFVYED